MGYYTAHALEVVEGDQGLIEAFRNECEGAQYAINECGDPSQPCKWYGREDDLRKFSASNPGALFMLSGEGEDSGNIWREFYRAGKRQRCEAVITFPKFNKELMD